MWKWVLGLPLVCVASACQPTRESVTAGEIGCVPGELKTYEVDSSSGWNQHAETWIAECRGRRFICTEVTTSSTDISWLFSESTDSVDSDISCREELPRTAAAQPPSPDLPAPSATSAPPPKGAGFEFGMDRSSARSRCEAAGHVWQEGTTATAQCSGTVSPPAGLKASTDLRFCADSLCAITVVHVPEGNWADAFYALDSGLTAKYGKPHARHVVVPATCRSKQQFDDCAKAGALNLKVRWQWSDEQSLTLALGGTPASSDAPAVRLRYVKPNQRSRIDLSGL